MVNIGCILCNHAYWGQEQGKGVCVCESEINAMKSKFRAKRTIISGFRNLIWHGTIMILFKSLKIMTYCNETSHTSL
jgi:hypothetical protein